jgi:hypothetical protein
VGVGGHVGAELGPDDHLGVGDPQPVSPLQPAVTRHPVPGEEVAALGVLERGEQRTGLSDLCDLVSSKFMENKIF